MVENLIMAALDDHFSFLGRTPPPGLPCFSGAILLTVSLSHACHMDNYRYHDSLKPSRPKRLACQEQAPLSSL